MLINHGYLMEGPVLLEFFGCFFLDPQNNKICSLNTNCGISLIILLASQPLERIRPKGADRLGKML